MELYPHQVKALAETEQFNRVAYYLDMGLGKTFVGSEKLMQLGAKVNLVICQKSKVQDWIEHFQTNYSLLIYDLTNKSDFRKFIDCVIENYFPLNHNLVGIINYELAFRKSELKQLKNFTLMLDESSLIQNENAKRSKFILHLNPKNIILLSGTPTGGKYEKLWSQLHLLGWNISKNLYWSQYVDFDYIDIKGFPVKVVRGYKNVERLKRKMQQYGCKFLKTEEVFDMPKQIFNTIKVDNTKEYRKFKKNSIITIDTKNLCEFHDDSDFYGKDITPHTELVGDTILKKMLYERQLCGQYNREKLNAFHDLVESTDDRIIVFYNFNDELYAIKNICTKLNKFLSIVNGQTKDLSMYEKYSNSVTAIQYNAGSMGLNLQKANKIVYFTPPLSSELFEQSKKRIHRIGQEQTCFYYLMICKGSIEERILKTLQERKDFTDELFRKEDECDD